MYYEKFFIISILTIFALGGQLKAEEKADDSWKVIIDKIQEKVKAESGLGKDFVIIFEKDPLDIIPGESQKVRRGVIPYEFQRLTIKGDGTFYIEVLDRAGKSLEKRQWMVDPEEISWLVKSLLQYGLDGLNRDEEERFVPTHTSSYYLTLGIGEIQKRIFLFYSSGGYDFREFKDQSRQIMFEHLKRYSEYLSERAGLRNTSKPILPIWKGNVLEEKIDTNNDGFIDWLRVKHGFYSLKPGTFIVCHYPGGVRKISFDKGSSEIEFFVNGYNLRDENIREEYFSVGTAYPTETEREEVGFPLLLSNYPKKDFRQTPDLIFKGKGPWQFQMRMDQTVVIKVKIGPPVGYADYLWFYIPSYSKNKIDFTDGGMVYTAKIGEYIWGSASDFSGWDNIGYFRRYFRLLKIEDDTATFEAGWEEKDGKDVLLKEAEIEINYSSPLKLN